MSDANHPLLPLSTPVLAEGGGTVRIGGVDSTDGLRVAAAGGWVGPLLRGLDGRRSRRAVVADALRAGAEPEAVEELLGELTAVGLLVELDPADLLVADAGSSAAERTAPELPAAVPAGGRAWQARRAAAVVVEGATRVGVPLAAALAASGVGRVTVRDAGTTTAGDAVVGGLTAADEGRPRAPAAADAVRRANPSTDLRPLPAGAEPDLVVLARPWAASDPLVAGLRRAGVPHLVATVRGQTGVVGPLVVPGATGCLRCGDLHRRDADPSWPVLAAQLTGGEQPPSGSTVTCLLTAALAAVQALAYLDRAAAPAVLDATLELRPPDLLPRLRRWPPHPACGCRHATPSPPPAERPAADDPVPGVIADGPVPRPGGAGACDRRLRAVRQAHGGQ
ncbi:ThiF family adenylyltransferase [Geodermatophilus sp. YIM 151500]|uniref:ThiF family adenylyltransferase n=1 Tax=Geodermatophilus sp. YIM 151500 TaxID=2984531 RepID=UPI0021E3DA27|nr:ThiF family adenylyltransferase [Geodermatophilus sp. YIM 151500]MCV2488669.1 ThiF family adenylyltransferase [Geodermatophilus sp. YIM 151500]